MGTKGSYSSWYFDDNYSVNWEDYRECGDYKNDWYTSVQGTKMLEILNENDVILSESGLEDLYQKYLMKIGEEILVEGVFNGYK